MIETRKLKSYFMIMNLLIGMIAFSGMLSAQSPQCPGGVCPENFDKIAGPNAPTPPNPVTPQNPPQNPPTTSPSPSKPPPLINAEGNVVFQPGSSIGLDGTITPPRVPPGKKPEIPRTPGIDGRPSPHRRWREEYLEVF